MTRLGTAGRRSVAVFAALAVAAAWGGGPAAVAEDDAPVVLEPAGGGAEQDPAQVAARIAPLATSKKMGTSAGTIVMDAATGQVLYEDDGSTALIPASTNKITTAVGALRAAGGATRLTTRVTRAGGTIYLVGAGDPLLVSRAPKAEPGQPVYPQPTSMKRLAKRTADALKAADGRSVELRVDDTLFTGPNWGPDWPEYFRTDGIVSPVSALAVDDGRVGGTWGTKSEDPAMAAGDRFAELLEEAGVEVGSVKREESPDSATDIASVESVPLYEIVIQALLTSDNDTAENLFRLAGIGAGFGGSFDGGSRAIGQALDDIGVSTVMASFVDGSGLSKENRSLPRLLAEVLRKAVSGDAGLWPISSGLPVAGVSGTLRYRFNQVNTEDAAGWVRGKTGTLTSVSSLAGFVQSESGRVLVYATLANDAKSSWDAAMTIDRIVAGVAGCGCPGSGR